MGIPITYSTQGQELDKMKTRKPKGVNFKYETIGHVAMVDASAMKRFLKRLARFGVQVAINEKRKR